MSSSDIFPFFLWHSLAPPAQDDLQCFVLLPVWPLTPLICPLNVSYSIAFYSPFTLPNLPNSFTYSLRLSHNRFGLKGYAIGWTCIERHSPGGWSLPRPHCPPLFRPCIMKNNTARGKNEENREENNNKALETNVFSKFNISSFCWSIKNSPARRS